MPSAASSLLPPLPDSPRDLDALTPAHWQALVTDDTGHAAGWMSAAARLGHAEAQLVMGQWLLDGRGMAASQPQAVMWFTRAAQQGQAMGMNMAGRCHEEGWGTPVDPVQALGWYRQAARLRLPEAQYNLANLLAAGKGVAQDHPQALALYRQATEQGYAKAWAKLGRYHEDGLLVPQDAAEAMRCYQRGAEGGDFRGQFAYAGMLAAQGQGADALSWLAKVPETATPRFMRQAGELLMQSPDVDFKAIGRDMLARAGAA